jgi:hypothetical protein
VWRGPTLVSVLMIARVPDSLARGYASGDCHRVVIGAFCGQKRLLRAQREWRGLKIRVEARATGHVVVNFLGRDLKARLMSLADERLSMVSRNVDQQTLKIPSAANGLEAIFEDR